MAHIRTKVACGWAGALKEGRSGNDAPLLCQQVFDVLSSNGDRLVRYMEAQMDGEADK